MRALPGLCVYCSEPATRKVEHYRRNGFFRNLFGLPTRSRPTWVCGIHQLDPWDYALSKETRKAWLRDWKEKM
jgi:hypothetical protein